MAINLISHFIRSLVHSLHWTNNCLQLIIISATKKKKRVCIIFLLYMNIWEILTHNLYLFWVLKVSNGYIKTEGKLNIAVVKRTILLR